MSERMVKKNGRSVRAKGATGEREVARLLTDTMEIVEREFTARGLWIVQHSRNVRRTAGIQSHTGGADLQGVPGLSIEVKRVERVELATWWRQCCEQALDGELPALFYRQSGRPWVVQTYVHVPIWTGYRIVGTVTAGAFLESYANYYRDYLQRSLRNDR